MRYIKTFETYSALDKQEIYYIDYILNSNESLNEGLIDRIKSVGRKGMLTAAMLTTLLSNPTFAKEYNDLSTNDRNTIEQMVSSSNSEENDNEVNISSSFQSGRYEISKEQKAAILQKLDKLVTYANKHKSKKYTITITASESLVPNKDFKTGEALPQLELSKRRAAQIKPIVEEFLKSHKTSNVMLVVNAIKGDTPWISSKGKDSRDYLKDQYVKVTINVNNNTTPEFICDVMGDADSGTEGKERNNYVSYSKTVDVTNQYGTGNFILKPGGIPDRILVYADGKLVGDSGFFADQKHNSTPEFKYVPRCILHLTKLYNESKKNSDIVGETELNNLNVIKVNSVEELMSLMLKDTSDNRSAQEWAKNNNPDVGPSIKEMVNMFKRGQREFVIYDLGAKKVAYKLEGKTDKVKVVVISPIPQTQFSLSVKCEEGITK